MKRFLAVITLVVLFAAPSFALTNREYGNLMSKPEFARADRRLNQVYNDLKETVSDAVWDVLKREQSEWVKWGRDRAAQAYMSKKRGRNRMKYVQAYTQATNDRADYLPERAEEIEMEIARGSRRSRRR
jgi:uncharacterized protein YecT (DUF1311 family)